MCPKQALVLYCVKEFCICGNISYIDPYYKKDLDICQCPLSPLLTLCYCLYVKLPPTNSWESTLSCFQQHIPLKKERSARNFQCILNSKL